MTTGVAQELIQPLTAIKMGSDFLNKRISRKDKIKEVHLSQIVQTISNQADRACEIVNRLKTLEDQISIQKEKVNINESIREVVEIVRYQLSIDNIGTELELDETLSPILSHKNRLGQVIYNLVINGCEAINEHQKAAGKTGNHLILIRSFQENEKVIFSVTDTGIGISASNLGRIHEPFFTTKSPERGKGLGLSISNQIVRDYGGRIDVESVENRGTTFKVTFPCAKS
jgi:signal transduction histidine kinase